nr:cytochrome b6/f subunit L [Ochrosphaera neapolitana]
MNALIGYFVLLTLMFSLAAGLYFGLRTIRLV